MNLAICAGGCDNGYCSSPGQCACYSGWIGYSCSQGNFAFFFLKNSHSF